jgi:hypothetical protein
MKLKVGQVMNSKGRGFFGTLIRLRNKLAYGKVESWTHSAIITEVKEDEVLIHEALTKGFTCKYYKKTDIEEKIRDRVYIIGETKVPLKDVKKLAKKYEGVGYGFKDIVHIILYWLFGTRAKFMFTHAQHLICSEAVSRILYDASGKKIDFEKEYAIPYDLIEPMHLWQSKQIKWN